MKQQITAILVALQFLTTYPPILRRPFQAQELGQSVAYFPLVGALIGAVLVGLNAVFSLLFPTTVVAAMLLVAWVVMTGSLHVDGFLDTCDGLLGGFTAEDRLRIMRDERLGGYALSGGILLFLVKFAGLTHVAGHAPALFLAPVLGRWAMVVAIILFPYAREQGLGRAMKHYTRRGQLILATMITLVLTWVTGALFGLIAFLVTLLLTGGLALFTMQRLPGLTGDIYGALCEIVETCVLLSFVAGAAV